MDRIYVNLWRMGDMRDVRKYLHGVQLTLLELEGVSENYQDAKFLYNLTMTITGIEDEQKLQAFKRATA